MNNKLPLPLAIIIASLFLAGCGNSLLQVTEPVPPEISQRQIAFPKYYRLAVTDNLNSEQSVRAIPLLHKYMASLGEKKGWLEDINGNAQSVVDIKISIIAYNSGSRTLRYLLPNTGKGQAHLSVEFHVDGQPSGKAAVTADIASGFFGGSMSDAMKAASKEIIKFMSQSF